MSTYGLKYYAEFQNFRKQLTRVEILQRDLPSGTTVLQIGDVCGLVLELQGGQDDVFAPIVKTQARLSMISSDDKPTAGGIKYGGWGEFFTPDDTLYKVVIKTKATPTTANWTTRWSGYITPDSWREGLEYRAAVTITARDNIGHLQDFEFDMQGDTYGLVKISDLITAAMTKVSMPMTLSVSGAPEYLEIADNGRKKLLDAYVVASNFKDKDWYTVLEGVLDSIGYTLRYTDNNRVTLAPMRHLPLTGEDDHQDQPQMAELEFYGGTGEQVPAVKKITDEHSYDYAGEVYLPILGNFSYGQTQTYREFMEGNILPGGGKINKAEHDAFFNKLTNAAGTVWETGSDMFDPSLYRHDERLPEGWDQYVFIPINGIDTDIRVQTLSFLSRTTDLTIRCVFSRRPIDIFGTNDWLTEEANSLYKIRYVVRYEKGNETRYLNNRGEWASSQAELEEEFDAQDDYATELVINLPACTELGDGGRIYLSFDGIWYKHWPGAAVYSYGDYARLASVSVSPNPNNLSKSIVKTVNDEKYNVLMERKPMLSPLSIDAPFSVPENYGSALFYYPTVGSVPKAYPFMMNWCTVSANVEKPLPVFIHQQILCYRGANLWELSGDCAPSGNDAFKFNTLCEYKNRTYILMSGTYDFLRGTIDGAVLREFLEYDDLWDDTEQPSPGEPGSWNSNPSYPGGGTPGSSAAGGSTAGGGGGGVNYFEEDGDGGIKLKDEYDYLWAAGPITAGGIGQGGGGGGGGLVEHIYRYGDLGGTFDNNDNDTFNAYAINSIHTRLQTVETTFASKSWVESKINTALSSVMSFVGTTTTNIKDYPTTNPITVNGSSYTATNGNVVLYGYKEFVWDGSSWKELGDEASWALKTVTITGTGYLTGGGTLEANRTLDIGSTYKGYIDNGQTAYGWGNHALAGYATQTWVGNNYLALSGGNMTGSVTFNHNLAIYFKNSSGTAVNALSVTSNVLYIGSASLPSNHYGSSQEFYYGSTLGFKLKDTGRLVVYGGLALSDVSGSPYLDYDSNANAWHLHGDLYADGTLTAGGIGGANSTLVTLAGEQTITGAKTFSAATTFSNNVSVSGSYTLSAPAFKANSINPASGSYINLASSSGYVTIGGTTTSTSYKLYVTGSAYATGSFINGSDAALKDDVLEIGEGYAIEKIMGLRPVSWKWNKRSLARGVSCGFIAQEVEKVIPEMVKSGGVYLGMEYTQLHAFEVASIQNHERRIRALEKENKELKEKLGYAA